MKVVRHGSNSFMAIIENRKEKAYLSQKKQEQKEWVPLYRESQASPVAEMDLETYDVRLCKGQQIETELHVYLVPPDRRSTPPT